MGFMVYAFERTGNGAEGFDVFMVLPNDNMD